MESPEFALYPLAVGAGAVRLGQIALSPMPGRYGSFEDDLSTVLRWAPDLVMSMTPQTELDRVGAGGFGADLQAVGVEWRHLPIVDFGAPQDDAMWANASIKGAGVLARGGKILIHCFGGCGRSGMAALRLMIEAGEDPETALARLRSVRSCAVETDDQKAWAFRFSA